MNRQCATSKQYWSVAEVARFLNLKISKIRYLVLRKAIPYIKIGRLLRFEKMEIEGWLEKLRNCPTENPRVHVRALSKQLRAACKSAKGKYG